MGHRCMWAGSISFSGHGGDERGDRSDASRRLGGSPADLSRGDRHRKRDLRNAGAGLAQVGRRSSERTAARGAGRRSGSWAGLRFRLCRTAASTEEWPRSACTSARMLAAAASAERCSKRSSRQSEEAGIWTLQAGSLPRERGERRHPQELRVSSRRGSREARTAVGPLARRPSARAAEHESRHRLLDQRARRRGRLRADKLDHPFGRPVSRGKGGIAWETGLAKRPRGESTEERSSR